ncbi:MAG: hypothetical protein ACO38Z_05970, partial [Candidatus Nanopelagicales bacterium]
MTDVGARPGDTPAEAAPTTPSAPSPDEETPRQTVAIPRPTNSAGPQSTVVIEDGVIPRRLRRPLDLAR